jgi:hypothetical protein
MVSALGHMTNNHLYDSYDFTFVNPGYKFLFKSMQASHYCLGHCPLRTFFFNKTVGIKKDELYMIDSDRRPLSNLRPLLKSASTDVIISHDGPILGYSQIGVLSKLSYL